MYFNTSYVKVQHSQKQLYIYLQNNFNTSYVKVQHEQMIVMPWEEYNFNTSYVKVQRRHGNLSYDEPLYFISIHPMLRFNKLRIGYAEYA